MIASVVESAFFLQKLSEFELIIITEKFKEGDCTAVV